MSQLERYFAYLSRNEMLTGIHQIRSVSYVPVCKSGRRLLVPYVLPMTQIFQIPWLITMSIAATRMYRALDEVFSSDVYDFNFFIASYRLVDAYWVSQNL